MPFCVEIAYAMPSRQWLIPVEIKTVTTAEEAIRLSQLLQHCPEIDLTKQAIGVFGQPVPLSYEVQPGDRIEIYRPLPIDPKDQRRARASSKRLR